MKLLVIAALIIGGLFIAADNPADATTNQACHQTEPHKIVCTIVVPTNTIHIRTRYMYNDDAKATFDWWPNWSTLKQP